MKNEVTFGSVFLSLGVLLQLLVYNLTGGSILSLISGACGIASVVLCSQRKISFYWFGFIQLITYVVICWDEKLYGEIGENAFYFVTMLYGLYHWDINYDKMADEVKTRKLNAEQMLWVTTGTTFATFLLFCLLQNTNDSQPLVDSITTVPAFVAQILMILRYKESWYYWLIIDVGSIIMWSIAGNWCMVTQFVFWTANCIYGLKKW